MDTSELPIFVEFRCILFLDTSESGVLGASRCIWNVWFYAHTSEMPDLWPFRCIIDLVSVGDTSGLRFQCPSRCTKVQYQVKYTSGWANIGHFRCIAKNSQNKIHRNSRFSSNPDVFQLISRDYTYISSQRTPAQINLTLISRDSTRFSSKCIPAQANFNKNIHRNGQKSSHPDVFILISRDYTCFPS